MSLFNVLFSYRAADDSGEAEAAASDASKSVRPAWGRPKLTIGASPAPAKKKTPLLPKFTISVNLYLSLSCLQSLGAQLGREKK